MDVPVLVEINLRAFSLGGVHDGAVDPQDFYAYHGTCIRCACATRSATAIRRSRRGDGDGGWRVSGSGGWDVGVCGSGWLLGAVRVLRTRVMVWLLWARSVSLVRSALGGGSDCRGPMVVRREINLRPRAKGISTGVTMMPCSTYR